jgi:ribosomal protein S17E
LLRDFEQYPDKFNDNFENNKEVLNKVVKTYKSNKNKLAGYIVVIIKKKKKARYFRKIIMKVLK